MVLPLGDGPQSAGALCLARPQGAPPYSCNDARSALDFLALNFLPGTQVASADTPRRTG